MRNIFFILLLMLTLTACGGKEDAPVDPTGEATTEETAGEEASGDVTSVEKMDAEETAATEAAAETEPETPDLPPESIGEVQLFDGTSIELRGFKKLGKYYIYIAGKLNGRLGAARDWPAAKQMHNTQRSIVDVNVNFLIPSPYSTLLG